MSSRSCGNSATTPGPARSRARSLQSSPGEAPAATGRAPCSPGAPEYERGTDVEETPAVARRPPGRRILGALQPRGAPFPALFGVPPVAAPATLRLCRMRLAPMDLGDLERARPA